MPYFDISILRCPVTSETLCFIGKKETREYVRNYDVHLLTLEEISAGYINESGTYFYPVFQDIILLLPVYALFIGKGDDARGKMAFDKERVFKYYNEINYQTKNGLKIYEDSPKWVDFREVSSEYIRNSFTRAKYYLNSKGKYFLDIASGPIGLKEYIELSDNYDYRICIDISMNALIQAKYNYSHKPGIFICGDITNIPIRDNTCDAVLCQHTLYHIPKDEQKTAVEELYRVAKSNANIAIVYSWFYHSWFMNICLFPIQIYRLARHFAGKLYVKLFHSKPRLYFYPHSPGWFKLQFKFGKDIEFYCWRSTNIYFLNLYVHRWLFGRRLLKFLKKLEDKYPKFWGSFGEYPVIVIKK
ncbi:MAG TPA: class I SAM-dependent methyltransferase [Bacteroidales bacterium]